jgi:hypothetical protein
MITASAVTSIVKGTARVTKANHCPAMNTSRAIITIQEYIQITACYSHGNLQRSKPTLLTEISRSVKRINGNGNNQGKTRSNEGGLLSSHATYVIVRIKSTP